MFFLRPIFFTLHKFPSCVRQLLGEQDRAQRVRHGQRRHQLQIPNRPLQQRVHDRRVEHTGQNMCTMFVLLLAFLHIFTHSHRPRLSESWKWRQALKQY